VELSWCPVESVDFGNAVFDSVGFGYIAAEAVGASQTTVSPAFIGRLTNVRRCARRCDIEQKTFYYQRMTKM